MAEKRGSQQHLPELNITNTFWTGTKAFSFSRNVKNYASVYVVESDTHQAFLFHQARVTTKIISFNPTRALLFLGFNNRNFLL